ncbi:Transcription factor [Seminavis robusta]|uniref:Transcription factor n=1 Tax=Seminavis robusta TaxID=568900 RepID=A0A9N8DQE7_9STRA|nr:Transcription factor [Seminavis robusta]|eukprot:Sro184_g079960.1 Transcription factor (234) ;mRNA; r:47954-48655
MQESTGSHAAAAASASDLEYYKTGTWEPEEHELFLEGYQKYGRMKGRWKMISALVETRSPNQVRSHAQKHFIKVLPSPNKRKKRKYVRRIAAKKPPAEKKQVYEPRYASFAESRSPPGDLAGLTPRPGPKSPPGDLTNVDTPLAYYVDKQPPPRMQLPIHLSNLGGSTMPYPSAAPMSPPGDLTNVDKPTRVQVDPPGEYAPKQTAFVPYNPRTMPVPTSCPSNTVDLYTEER